MNETVQNLTDGGKAAGPPLGLLGARLGLPCQLASFSLVIGSMGQLKDAAVAILQKELPR